MSKPNAFSKDYESAIDWSLTVRMTTLSERNSASRQRRLKSDDPAVRQAAEGSMGTLSKRSATGKRRAKA